jgi:hypothetical protein
MTAAVLVTAAVLTLATGAVRRATRQARRRAALNREAMVLHERAQSMLAHYKPEQVLARRARRRAHRQRQRWAEQQAEWSAGERQWN